MTCARRFLLLVLALATALAAAHGPSSVPLRSAVRALDERAHAALVQAADALLSASSAGPRALPQAIDAIELQHPALAEAVWSRWLDRVAAAPVLLDTERAALERLVDRAPVSWIEHHEAGLHAMPAFAVAERARALLDFDRRWRAAAALLDRPDRLIRAITASVAAEAVEFEVIELALQQAGPGMRAALIRQLPFAAPSVARDRALLQLARLERAGQLLPALVADSTPWIAQQALIEAMEQGGSALVDAAAQAAARPELGGLAVEAHVRAGGALERLWDWLGDPDFGADAARVLAAEDALLVDRVRARIERAAPLARLRMLLALRLADRADADRLLAELEDADWLQPAQREVLQAWRR